MNANGFKLFAIVAVALLAGCVSLPIPGMTGSEALSVRLPVVPTLPSPSDSDSGPRISALGFYEMNNGQWGAKVTRVDGYFRAELGKTYRFAVRAVVFKEGQILKTCGVVEWRQKDGTIRHITPPCSSGGPVYRGPVSTGKNVTYYEWISTNVSNPGVSATVRLWVEDANGQVSNTEVLEPVIVVKPPVPPPAVPPMETRVGQQ